MDFDDFTEIVSSVILRDSGRPIEDLLDNATGGLARAAEQLVLTKDAFVVLVVGMAESPHTRTATAIDGPTGAAILAATLESIGVSVTLVTADYHLQAVEAAVNGLGVGLSNPIRTVVTVPGTDSNTECEFLSLELREAGLSHVIEIGQSEIVGKGIPGIHEFCSLGGVFSRGRLSELSDAHFIEIIDDFRKYPSDSEKGIQPTSTAMPDALVLSATSNWGAYALAVAVRLLSPNQGVLSFDPLSLDSHFSSLRCFIESGATDAASSINELSIDGFRWNEYAQVLAAVSAIAESCIPR